MSTCEENVGKAEQRAVKIRQACKQKVNVDFPC